MSITVIEVHEHMQPIGPSVVAIGVFDGVHLGHQALLLDTSAHAQRLHAHSVALTFDRDPDQVVTPEAAAPQLLTLEEKCRFIGEFGIDTVLLVPFTPQLSRLSPQEFLDKMLLTCCELQGIHVGEDFRFGMGASGDIDTLRAWGESHGVHVEGHRLVMSGHEPVTSTRIRALVSEGNVEEAAELLGRPPRVAGRVHRGRGEGRTLGFPTANVVPVPYAALPADGVYAGRAILADGEAWPAAISTGRPPMFPDALDTLEAHLIGFEGDIYETHITLEFAAWIREQLEFDSVEDLASAIADDVRIAAKTARRRWAGESADEYDPDIEWVALAEPRRVSGLFGDAGFSAALVTAPLDAAGIPHAWDPYAPEDMPAMRAGYGVFDRKFTLLVPADREDEAREVMRASGVRL